MNSPVVNHPTVNVIRKYIYYSDILLTHALLINVSYYRLIRGSNGLTTIQLLRQHQESLQQHLASSASPSSSPTSLSPPINHLSLMQKESRTDSDEDNNDMPTDLRKNYD